MATYNLLWGYITFLITSNGYIRWPHRRWHLNKRSHKPDCDLFELAESVRTLVCCTIHLWSTLVSSVNIIQQSALFAHWQRIAFDLVLVFFSSMYVCIVFNPKSRFRTRDIYLSLSLWGRIVRRTAEILARFDFISILKFLHAAVQNVLGDFLFARHPKEANYVNTSF